VPYRPGVLEPGLSATVEVVVTDSDTAVALGSGDVEVLGTPRVLALLEAATVAAVAGTLDPNLTTVGTRVELDHLAPSPLGATVRAGAELVEVAGRRLTFEVRMSQGGRDVARGRVVRAVVERDRFAAGR
jgi:fluoroacetyl-CoA thioesterase